MTAIGVGEGPGDVADDVDTSVIDALLDRRDRRHQEAVRWFDGTDEELATTPLVLAEVDHLASAGAGRRAADAFREDVRARAYVVSWWDPAAAQSVEVAERYEDLGLSLTDGSLVAPAARLGTIRIATFDERHVRAVRPLDGRPAFLLLPRDADRA